MPRDGVARHADWRDQARALLANRDARAASASSNGDKLVKGDDPDLRVRQWLETTVSARQADEGARDASAAELLVRLETAAIAELADAIADLEHPAVLSEWAEKELERERSSFEKLMASEALSPCERGRGIDAFQRRLGWWSDVIALLDGNPCGDPFALLDHRLAKAINEASALQAPELRDEAERLRRDTLERNILAEIERPLEPSSATELWRRRFLLSRLAIDPSIDETLRRRIDDRRAALANAADAKLKAEGQSSARQREEILVEARAEWHDNLTVVGETPADRACRILEEAEDDLGRLAESMARDGSADARRRWRRARSLHAHARAEEQEQKLTMRLKDLLGKRSAAWLDNLVLALILAISALIIVELIWEWRGTVPPLLQEVFAWADLVICSLLMAELLLRLALVDDRLFYLRRHLLVDFLPSIPFGFMAHQLTAIERFSGPASVELVRLLRLPSVARYARLARPVVRLVRLATFSLRLLDQLVRRHAETLNRNIVLFETGRPDATERRCRHLLVEMRRRLRRREGDFHSRLEPADRRALLGDELADIRTRLNVGPKRLATSPRRVDRQVPVESVIETLVEMTPEQILDEMGPTFAQSVRRGVRLLNIPILRRAPIVGELVARRKEPPADVAAVAANLLGVVLQRLLDAIYFIVDLRATVSAPVFVDRLGAALVNATKRPASRLLLFGALLMILGALVWPIPVLGPVVNWIDRVLVRPIILIGILCLVPLAVGMWLRRIANQAAEYSERVVEAQFAAQTKRAKLTHRQEDELFLAKRVIEPELRLRACDDQPGAPTNCPTKAWLREQEAMFVKTIDLLYQDYLDGSLFHRSDTKTATQLLGNLALANLRLSSLAHTLAESSRLRALDLNRSGSILGGPYMWFNYITRGVTQQTARLIVDYNRHAIPWERLACSPERDRERFRQWLSRRLGIGPSSVRLPPPVTAEAAAPRAATCRRRAQAEQFLETVDFMAVDFLTEDVERTVTITRKYGEQVAELLCRDRRENVRKAFRGVPLHRIPRDQRTINPFVWYESNLSRGRIVLAPLRAMAAAARGVGRLCSQLSRVIRDLLSPAVEIAPGEEIDDYAVARRKIHRMRRPIFMSSLTLRARFDIEYMGLSLPSASIPRPARSELEKDLTFIGASRRERLFTDHLYREHQTRLEWIRRWLDRLGWSLPSLTGFLASDFPHLADRGAEVVRALATAMLTDHDDVFSLMASIEAMARLRDYCQDPSAEANVLPAGLPPAVDPRAPRWHFADTRFYRLRLRGRVSRLLAHPLLASLDADAKERLRRLIKRRRGALDGWIRVFVDQGGDDPWEVARRRLREVVRRTDLWSDQIIALRTIQSLTMVEVHRYGQMVWKLGGYEDIPGQMSDPPGPLVPVDTPSFAGPISANLSP